MAKELLRMEGITKIYGNGFMANKDISFSVNEGEIHALIGENGAGKTTLMKILFGLENCQEGKIFIEGKECYIANPLDAIDKGVGMVHQHFMLVEDFTVTQNIILGNETTSHAGVVDMKRARKQILEIVEKYGLEVDPDAKVNDISVGMQQRVEILKALYRGAELLILDEPTRGVDIGAKKEIYSIINQLAKKGVAIIMVSSELPEVLGMSDRIMVVREGMVRGIIGQDEADQEKIMTLATGGTLS